MCCAVLIYIRLMFGTDHPFFPPPLERDGGEWLSVTSNSAAVRSALGNDIKTIGNIMGDNAVRVLCLDK